MINKPSYENVLHTLINNLNNASKSSEREIAHLLLVNFAEIENVSIEALAQMCLTTQSTLTRYIKKLGYENYNQFKNYVVAFQQIIASEVNNDIFQTKHSQLVPQTCNNAIEAINETNEKMIETNIDIITDYIEQAKKITIIGIDYSQIVALDAQLRFMRYNKLMQTAVQTSKQQQLVEQLRADDLLIILSNSGETKGLIEAISQLAPGVKCAVISSNPQAPIAKMIPGSKLLLTAGEIDPKLNSAMSGRLSLLIAIDCLYVSYGIKYANRKVNYK